MTGIRKKVAAKRKVFEEQEKYSSMINELLYGIKDIKLLDLKEQYKKITIEKFEEASSIEYDGDNYENKYNKIANLIEFTTMGIVLLVGLFLMKKNMITSSTLIIIYMYKNNIFSFVDKLVVLMDTRLSFNLSCSRLFTLLDDTKYTKEKYGNNKINKSKGIIEFINVSFAYDNKKIINNCSFKTEQYDTIAIIGESGITLSQGQKQRLGIARALIKNTPIILLDEITSALDKDTGNNIKKLIDNIKKNHTIIMVSHDLQFIKDYKKYLLKNGKIKEL